MWFDLLLILLLVFPLVHGTGSLVRKSGSPHPRGDEARLNL